VGVGDVDSPEFAGIYAAKDQGFYSQLGLEVDLKHFPTGADVNKAVADSAVNYGVSSPVDVVLARSGGQATKAVAAVYQTSPLMIACDKNAKVSTVADIKNKTIGNTGGNDQIAALYAKIMIGAGLKPSDAILKTINDPVDALQTGTARCAFVDRATQTYLLDQAKIDYDKLLPEKFGTHFYGDVLVASDGAIRQDKSQTIRFVQATLKGWLYAVQHQAQANDILSKYVDAAFKDSALRQSALSAISPLVKPAGELFLGGMDSSNWQQIYNGVKAAALLQSDVLPNDLYASQFVK